ncbi:putative toxin-antitoxin system toxin component, PIN family [Arcicella sp. LKC2W]|jgi:putative PIN family toxin of toxin-antitoxin system|uniref:putative toxin-antitoxin system toxin component, PIN family n=1 Tax=Arcicella sp. LKC2W TaxID=2984198 RepID=UPI002B200495|nr:putative toxin-antitoxin system toxin component, PIN family [Arcicella sp. LKC2W]MEA5458763.1 putative toxin-antitoxin system toxin component, PIN family [Arcicella sp. LKC2W]
MRIVLDTNILLVSVSDRSPYHLIFKSFIEERYEICVTTEILDEYAEILSKYSSQFLATNTLEVIENAANSVLITRYFAFELIKNDPDDNKFVDCAIASNADFIVTNDGHFNVLKEIPFPQVNIISIDDFMEILKVSI